MIMGRDIKTSRQLCEAVQPETYLQAAGQSRHEFLVSAIVSTYNSEKFIRGCLEDLTAQTLFQAGKVEIVIVNSASPQNEEVIIQTFLAKYPDKISYIRTDDRETLYAAWNRGIEAARGAYLCNANTDDRHRQDALEVQSKCLDSSPEIDLVYGDCYVSTIPNETYDENDKSNLYRYPEFFAPAALLHYQLGPQPMWRKSVHLKVGLFDGSYKAAGDYDFNIRFAAQCKAHHIAEPLGLYLEHANAISFRDETMQRENALIDTRYKTAEITLKLYANTGIPCATPAEKARVLLDLGNRALEYFPPWKKGVAESNCGLAERFFSSALEYDCGNYAAANNLAVTRYLLGDQNTAEQILLSVPSTEANSIIADNLKEIRSRGTQVQFISSTLNRPSQRQLYSANEAASQSTAVRNSDKGRFLSICMVASVGRIDPYDATGGLETAMRHTASALARRGHRVALVGQMTREAGNYDGVRYLHFDEWNSCPPCEFGADADVLAFASGPDLGSYRHAGPGTVKVALFHHQELAFLGNIDALQVTNRTADAVICVSNAVRNNLMRDGVLPQKLHVAYNGVDLDLFSPREVARESQRILFVGALVPDKNIEMLIRAFLDVSQHYPAAELHICGGASLWDSPEFIDRAAVARFSSRIIFHGILSSEALAEQYSRASICVIPSKFESFSLVSLEAQACGCVPLVADVGGVPETIDHGVSGFVYSPNDKATLAGALSALLADPARLSEAGRHAAQFAAATFSWDKTAAEYEDIICRVMECKRLDASAVASREPKVSVIIPCYNYARYLTDAVESVLNQSVQDFEIIIVNDGSTDNSREVAEQIIAANPEYSIRLVNQENSGNPSCTRNRGIKEAHGAYILPLDADDALAPAMLAECLNVLEHNPTVAFAYTDRLDFDGAEQIVSAGDYDFGRLKYQNHISYCALIRRTVWEDVGGYREVGYEDWDFWIAAGAKGHFGRRIPLPLFMYRRHDTGRFQNDSRNAEKLHARIMVNNSICYSREEVMAAEKLLRDANNRGEACPLVSVIVPTYNRPGMLGDTLQSILNQTYHNIEIIVVNDAGADVEGIVNHHNHNGRISYARHASNRGLGAARNTGIKLARGKYIAYLDDDDLFYPDHVATLVNALEGSDYMVAYTDAHRAHQVLDNGRYVLVGRDVPYSHDFNYDAILINNFVPVLCFMHEKKCLDSSGLFDESLTTHEDWDLWIRMSRSFRFNHVKKVTCEFTWRQDGSTMTSSRKDDFIRTTRIIYEKYRQFSAGNPALLELQRKVLSNDEPSETCSQQEQSHHKAGQMQHGATAAPDHASELLTEADHFVKAGRLDEAETCYRRVLTADPVNTQALVGVGVLRHLSGKHSEAAISFQKALKSTPGHVKALCGLGMVRTAQGRLDEGMKLFREALESEPDNPTALHELLKVAYHTDRLTEAEPYLEGYLRYHPGDIHILFSLAGLRYRTGNFDAAHEALEMVLAFEPSYEGGVELAEQISRAKAGQPPGNGTSIVNEPAATAAVLCEQGNICAGEGKTDEAAELFQQALAADPGNSAAFVGIGVLKLLEGKNSEAAMAFSNAHKSSPDSVKALSGLGLAYAAMGKQKEAFEQFKAALAIDPEDLTALHELLKASYALDRLDEAEPALLNYLRHHPADSHLLFSLAGLRYRRGRYPESLDVLEQLLLLNPDYEGAPELLQQINTMLTGPTDEQQLAAVP